MPETAAPLARRQRERLGDLPAQPVLALLPLIPAKGDRAYVAILPMGDGHLAVEVGGGAAAAALVLEGEATRPLYLPRAVVSTLAARHPKGERLVLDGPAADASPLLRAAVLDGSSSASMFTAEAVPVEGGPSITAMVSGHPLRAADDPRSPLLDPKLLGIAVSVMARLAGGPFRLGLADHPLLGALLRADIPEEGAEGPLLGATIALARCIRPGEAQG